jgi:hypothetical protein
VANADFDIPDLGMSTIARHSLATYGNLAPRLVRAYFVPCDQLRVSLR